MWILFAAPLAIHPFDLVRVDVPGHPDAVTSSGTGSVLLAPPTDGTPWEWESVPETTVWPAEEAVEATNADLWHDLGHTGAGVKVAIFDLGWFGTEPLVDAVSTHDCFVQRSCDLPIDTWRPRFGFEEGRHGWGCAEVVRGVAPDAELYLVRVNGVTTLENAVEWAIREEIDVISMSLAFFNSSFYDGTGRVGRLMDELVANNILMVASSGNYARGHHKSRFTDGDADGRMDFDGSNGLDVFLRAGAPRGVYLSWNQFSSCGATDLDLVLRDREGNILGTSEAEQVLGGERCSPVERVRGTVDEDAWARLEVVHRGGATANVEVNLLATAGQIANSQAEGSLSDPGSHPSVFTVGAVRADDYLRNDVESFSSWGPNLLGHPKPDIVGPDGLTTEAYGAVGFYGTSAATPAVAGLVAVVMSSDPSLSPYEAADKLRAWAYSPDLEDTSPRWGAGKARLPTSPSETACGQRPLWAGLLLAPLLAFRRRRGERAEGTSTR